MTLLLASHPRFWEHETGAGHPERPARLDAVRAGIHRAGLDEAIQPLVPRAATEEDLSVVHPRAYVESIERFCAAGGGHLDADTTASVGSGEAALLAAGAGLTAIEALDAGEGDAAFCAVRPPGHHALPTRAMGFCLFNNVAVAAAHLAGRGERVLVVDYDAHHGNGTQAMFWRSPQVAYVSFHEWPLYPGTGAIDEMGADEGLGTTINFPLPPGATGDVVRDGIERVVVPFAASFEPTWLLLSAGYDGHRADPLTQLGLTAGDFGDITDLLALAPSGQRLLFLEGGYDLDALAQSVGASLAALLGERYRPEPPSAHGPETDVVDRVVDARRRLADEGGSGGAHG
jgi:acetoin utilization deacetylase AcuC-like enzyme